MTSSWMDPQVIASLSASGVALGLGVFSNVRSWMDRRADVRRANQSTAQLVLMNYTEEDRETEESMIMRKSIIGSGMLTIRTLSAHIYNESPVPIFNIHLLSSGDTQVESWIRKGEKEAERQIYSDRIEIIRPRQSVLVFGSELLPGQVGMLGVKFSIPSGYSREMWLEPISFNGVQ